jgi:hypothetical protein
MGKIIAAAGILLVAISIYSFSEAWNPHEREFIRSFEQSDTRSMEATLQEHASAMDLSACLYSVLFSYYPEEQEYIAPLNANKTLALASIHMLVDHGADPNTYPSYYYCRGRLTGKLSLMDYSTAYIKQYPLELAIEYNLNIQILQFLLDSGADPQLYGSVPVLYTAVHDNNIALARVLVENGVSVNGPVVGEKNYALVYAALWGRYEIVRLLVEAGAKVNQAQGGFGGPEKTAAEAAYEMNELDIYIYLKDNGAMYTAPFQPTAIPSGNAAGAYGRDFSGTVNHALESPLENGIYRVLGRSEELILTTVGNSGVVVFRESSGRSLDGICSTNGNKLTITILGRIFYYTITSRRSFSGNGELWYRTGY